MIKKLLAAILTLGVMSGCYTISFAAEPMLKIKVYAPIHMLSCLDNVLSYGVAYTDATGVQRVVTISGECSNDDALGKYENNREFLIPASQITNKTIDYAYVTVSIKMGNGKYEDRTYYYNSDGTSSLFKEGFIWEKNEDKTILVYLDSPYVVTIKNDKAVNDYYIKPGGEGGKPSVKDEVEELYHHYEIERGERVYFDKDNKNVTLICKDNHVYVPIRCLTELFKFKVDYSIQDEYTKVDIISSDGKINLTLRTGYSSYVKNGNIEYFEGEMMPFISEGRTYVPLRFLESFGMGIEYSSVNSMIYIKPRTYEIVN